MVCAQDADGFLGAAGQQDLVLAADSAREILGLSAYKAGNFAKSKEWLQKIVDDGTWLAGRGLGDPGRLIGVCGLTVEEFQYAPGVNKCAVDDGSGPMPLREPHNWMLSLLLYQGVIGIAAMVALLLAYWWRPPPDPAFTLSALPAALYIGAASFGVVLSSPFGILPIATFTAFAISRRLRSADTDKVALSAL